MLATTRLNSPGPPLAMAAAAHPRLQLARQRMAARAHHQHHAAQAAATAAASQLAVQPVTAEEEAVPQQADAPSSNHEGAVLMQGFGWDSCRKGNWYGRIRDQVQHMAAAGITHVWLPPPSRSVAPEGYMPGQLYDLNSSYGDQQQLVALVQALKEAGISPIADIVINHRCADEQDAHGRWNIYRDDIPHPGPSIAWGPWAIAGSDPEFGGQGGHDTGADFWGAPDIDHHNPAVRDGVAGWLAWLKSHVGFDGFRFDFVKGYASHFVKDYIEASGAHQGLHVGEFWTDLDWSGPDGALQHNQDGARNALCHWLNGVGRRAAAFDFVQKGVLQEAVKRCEYWRLKGPDGKPQGLLGWWPKRAVSFVDNHDTGSSQQHWPFPHRHVGLGYAYILTHPGIPCVFWEHYYDWGSEMQATIDALLQARKRQDIVSTSPVTILCAEADMYVAEVAGRMLVKLGPRHDMGPHAPCKDRWHKVVSGRDFCVWERSS